MSLELPMIVYGNGDLFLELFNAIAAVLGGHIYNELIKLALCLTSTWAIIRYTAVRNITPLVQWFVTYYIAFYIVLVPTVTLNIQDQLNIGKPYVVDNVPLGLAVVANLSTGIGSGLTELMEQDFSLPNNLLYEKTGMVMASRLVLASTQFQITDPNTQKSLQSFVHQCVFYDVLLNKYSWNDLLNATNIWTFVGNYASPARAFVYYQQGNTQIVTCQQGYSMLNQDWQNAIQEAASRYGSRLFPDSSDAKAQLLSYLPDSYSFLTNISDDAATIMQQNMMVNALQNGIMQMSITTNASAALEAYAYTKAQQQKRLTNETVGDMAAYWLPLMKNVLEATLYGSFIFIFLLLLFPFGASVFKYYVASLMWVQLWAPLYAILNLFMNFYAQSHNLGALNLGNSSSGLAFSTQGGLAQVNSDLASLAGYLSLSVPLLATGIVKGMMSVFSTAAQYIAGVTQGAASSAAGDAVAGNFSLGNTNFSNHSSYNTSANHFDANARVFSGMYTAQMPGGSTLSVSPDGSLIMNNQSAISSLGTSINLAQSIRTMASQQADTAYSTALTNANAYVSSLSSGLRQLQDLSSHTGTSESDASGSSVTLSGGTTAAINHYDQLTERFAHDNNISQSYASRMLLSAYLSGKAGVQGDLGLDAFGTGAKASIGGDAGLKGEKDASWSHESRSLYSAAQEYVKNTNFSQSVDMAVKGMQDHSYRTANEQGQRLMDSIGSSFDQASQTRQEAMNNYQEAQSYRQVASFAEENATSINSNASQTFSNWLQNQGLSSGTIEDMMTNHPEAAQAYAQKFTQEQASQYLESFHQTAGSSVSSIQSTYDQNNFSIPGEQKIKENLNTSQQSVTKSAIQEGLNKTAPIDTQTIQDAKEIISGSEYAVTTSKTMIGEKSAQLKDSVHEKIND